MARVLGLDVGRRFVGVALSDAGNRLAFPWLGYARAAEPSADAAVLAALAAEHGVGRLVVGLPRTRQGREGRSCAAVRAYVASLFPSGGELQRHGLRAADVAYCDERFTTQAADDLMSDAGWRKRRKSKAESDSQAAALILQEHLDDAR